MTAFIYSINYNGTITKDLYTKLNMCSPQRDQFAKYIFSILVRYNLSKQKILHENMYLSVL